MENTNPEQAGAEQDEATPFNQRNTAAQGVGEPEQIPADVDPATMGEEQTEGEAAEGGEAQRDA